MKKSKYIDEDFMSYGDFTTNPDIITDKKVILNSEVRDAEFDYDRCMDDLKKTVTETLSIPSIFKKGR
jgi:hypothetical protein